MPPPTGGAHEMTRGCPGTAARERFNSGTEASRTGAKNISGGNRASPVFWLYQIIIESCVRSRNHGGKTRLTNGGFPYSLVQCGSGCFVLAHQNVIVQCYYFLEVISRSLHRTTASAMTIARQYSSSVVDGRIWGYRVAIANRVSFADSCIVSGIKIPVFMRIVTSAARSWIYGYGIL